MNEIEPRSAVKPRKYRGMHPTLAFVGMGVVFLILGLLMILRGGHHDANPPEPVKPGATRPG